MGDLLWYLFVLALLALLIVAAIWVLRNYINGVSPVAALFAPRPERRLAVVEQAAVDSRRRLLLVRRDDVEHLIMTGGPVDLVIETGIGATGGVPAVTSEPSPSVFTRQPRTLGQTAAAEPAAE
jgi:hypothetical protein